MYVFSLSYIFFFSRSSVFQLATAVYYLVMDALIISQFTYYHIKNKKKKVYVVGKEESL